MSDDKYIHRKFLDMDGNFIRQESLSKSGGNSGHQTTLKKDGYIYDLIWFEPEENKWRATYKKRARDVKVGLKQDTGLENGVNGSAKNVMTNTMEKLKEDVNAELN